VKNILLWFYIVNITLLIIHEIDSAYWHEWKLFKIHFKLPGPAVGDGQDILFLIFHFPLVIIFLYGLIQVYNFNLAGFIFSYVAVTFGIACFIIHTYFLRKGHKEFSTPISLSIIYSYLGVSVIQAIITTIYIAN